MSTALVKRTHYFRFDLRYMAFYSVLAAVSKIAADRLWHQNNLEWVRYAAIESFAKKRLSFWLVKFLTSKGVRAELLAKVSKHIDQHIDQTKAK